MADGRALNREKGPQRGLERCLLAPGAAATFACLPGLSLCGVWEARSRPSAPQDGCIIIPQCRPKCPLSTAALQPRRGCFQVLGELDVVSPGVPPCPFVGCLGAFATKESSLCGLGRV